MQVLHQQVIGSGDQANNRLFTQPQASINGQDKKEDD
jgi:hypothetical protein